MYALLLLGLLSVGATVLLTVASATTENALGKEDREEVIASVEAGLLTLLGFDARPRPQGPIHVPESLRKLYLRQKTVGIADIAKRGIHTRSANTVRSFYHVESELDNMFQSPNRFRLSFDLRDLPSEEKLQAAELILSRVAWSIEPLDGSKEIQRANNDSLKIKSVMLNVLVHDIVRPGVKGKRKPQLRLLDRKTLNSRNNRTISLDVKPAIARWLFEKNHNHGLLVEIVGKEAARNREHVRLRRNVDESSDIWREMKPILFAYTDDGKNKIASASEIIERRERRDTLRNNRRRNRAENCRRHPLEINFADIGWSDWILAPLQYEAFYCNGYCPFPLADHLNSTNHAMVQNVVHSIHPNLVPKACCVPTALGSISMLYIDKYNKVVLKNYQDMIVLGCGCR